MINRKSAREMKLKHLIQSKLIAYSAKLSSSSFSSRNHSNSKCPKTSRISHKKDKPSLISPIRLLEKKMVENLHKYNTTTTVYNVKIINDIIYDEKKHIVCLFKNYLLWDEISDFLKRFYYKRESITRLPKITGYYEKYTLFAPVYYQLDCIKIMVKNIKRKKRYLEIIEENEDKIDQNDQGRKAKDFKIIIKPEDVKTDENDKTFKSYYNNRNNGMNDDRDLSLSININTMDNFDNTNNLSQLFNKVINTTSMSIANNEFNWDNDEISDSLFNLDQNNNCLSQSPHYDKQTNLHTKNKNMKRIEIKKLNFNQLKGIGSNNHNLEFADTPKGSLINNKVNKFSKKKLIDHSKRISNNHLKDNITKGNGNANKNNQCIVKTNKEQIPSLTVANKSKHKNRIIKDNNNKFISIDNLFKIIHFNNKQSPDRKASIAVRIASNSKGREINNKINKEIPIANPTIQANHHESSNLKKRKTNLVINHNTIKPTKPSLTLRSNSSRSESKSVSQSQSQSQSQSKTKVIKKKLAYEFRQKIKNSINPLNTHTNAMSQYSKPMLSTQNDKILISFLKPQTIDNHHYTNKPIINYTKNNRSPSNSNNNNGCYNDPIITQKKISNHTQATAASNTSKTKDKISYEVNNLHLSIHKQTNGNSNESNSVHRDNHTINININCNVITNQRDDKVKKEVSIGKETRNLDRKISRNDKNVIHKLQSSHTNRIKNMVIPINSSTSGKEKISKNQAKSHIKNRKVEKNRNQLINNSNSCNNNDRHETSMSIRRNNQIVIETQRKYPLTSRNEKESIPVYLLNKIMTIKK